MTARLARSATLLALVATSTASWAGVDLEIRSGDKITATISSATDVEIVRFRLPKGAVVSVKGAAAKKGPQIHLQFKDPAGSPIASAGGRAAAISKQVAPASGLYSVEVTSKDGASTGDYAFAVKWKSPKSFGRTLTVPPAGTADMSFSADAVASATFSVKPAKNSAAAPTLASWTKPDASIAALSGTSQKTTLDATGDFVLTVASATGGDAVAGVKIRPPAASKYRYPLTTATIGGGNSAFSRVVGPRGGKVAAPFVAADQPGAALDGAGVSVPAGALRLGTAIVIATTSDFATKGTLTGAGPTVYFGPEQLRFDAVDKAKTAALTIPFDASCAAVTNELTIYARDVKGVVTVVAKPYTYDLAAGTVSFASGHLGRFRAMWPKPVQSPNNFLTIANVTAAQDVCNAYDPSGATPPISLFVADANNGAVLALRLTDAATQTYSKETWVGGGTQTATPADRRQFRFPSDDILNAVYATTDGVLYAAMQWQIFRVDPGTGIVTRVAGTGAAGDTGDGGSPLQATFTEILDIVADLNGDIFVADAAAHRIRRVTTSASPTISTWAGTGKQDFGVDGTDPTTTTFFNPTSLSFAPSGGLYVADFHRIRHLDPARNVNVTVAGDATGVQFGSTGDGGPPLAARFRVIEAISPYCDPLNPADESLVVADYPDETLRLVNLSKGTVRLVAGVHGTAGFNSDVGSTPGLLDTPYAIATTPGVVFVVDQGNGKIRAITNP